MQMRAANAAPYATTVIPHFRRRMHHSGCRIQLTNSRAAISDEENSEFEDDLAIPPRQGRQSRSADDGDATNGDVLDEDEEEEEEEEEDDDLDEDE